MPVPQTVETVHRKMLKSYFLLTAGLLTQAYRRKEMSARKQEK